jgi:hypothetical protein
MEWAYERKMFEIDETKLVKKYGSHSIRQASSQGRGDKGKRVTEESSCIP